MSLRAVSSNPAAITAGNIDGAAIGATTPASGRFTAFSAGGPVTNTGSTYTVLAGDYALIANAAATQTLTLGSAVQGRQLLIRTIAAFTVVLASANVVPIAGGAAGTAILAAVAGTWALLQGDGTNWQIMAA